MLEGPKKFLPKPEPAPGRRDDDDDDYDYDDDNLPALAKLKDQTTMAYDSTYATSILIRSNKMQQYAGIYLLQNHSTYFGCPSNPPSGVHKTITAASGTCHSI